jgi:dTDP-L-rhamnose 4-epimerase
MPEIAKFFDVNCVGTARLLETIRDRNLPVRKVVVASSQAVYVEGAVSCSHHGLQFPARRESLAMAAGHFGVACPVCGAESTPALTPETAPMGGETVYAMTKVDQEKLVLAWSRQAGIPAVALRYACTYGPRQSVFNPYTGVIAVFCTRLLNGLAPILYEDGEQTRDLCHVSDVARANLVAATSDRLDGQAVNVGTGRATSIRRLAELLAELLEVDLPVELAGAFRPGEMRALTPDVSRAVGAGFRAEVSLEDGLASYVAWIRDQGSIDERFAESLRRLRQVGAVQPVAR